MEIAISEQKEEKDTIERLTPERMQAVWTGNSVFAWCLIWEVFPGAAQVLYLI